ncbi:helix-turn-helix domain-containing protein [Pseudoalteromonas sp. PS5]|uniref:helix-turn-helix transcriptional regulator n=1 Tax=Pseudoalteromonas sp. PS5 TaxID=1437473 RepID=UPI000FFF04AC|nr:helix-turn-helix domain-containing protein [Pseudoalteromonas sp. PS5]RXF02560.1 helix-turn-helix domain-containing protein [Pseudoalteromonas sp. PS5]
MQIAKRVSHIDRLIENKVSFAANNVELSIYDTYESANKVKLTSGEVLFCAMVSGKKVMHVDSCDYHQPFLPHQSFVLAPEQTVHIDFPDASLSSPTTCLAIEISREKIKAVSDKLSLSLCDEVTYQKQLIHAEHNWQTQHCLAKLFHLFSENEHNREYFIDLAMDELIARLLQQQSRDLLLNAVKHTPDRNGLYQAVHYLETHLEQPLDVDKLCKLSCMSRSRFFSQFKKSFATTPQQWLQARRLTEAKAKLKAGAQITAVSFTLGFKHPSQFSRAFKQAFNVTPKNYQLQTLKVDKSD